MTVERLIIGNQNPQIAEGVRDADFESAEVDCVEAFLPGMFEQDFKSSLAWNAVHQILQFFGFPTIQPLLIDFDDTLQMTDAKNKFFL